mmetsp:Transcript_89889/g.141960  ORF Transcript_89889/g.141960 Transcript_89889/m.141960 type:complete len:958 (+) Transcript_89889:184-3057(+)
MVAPIAHKCKPKICDVGGGGNILPILKDTEQRWNKFPLRSTIYLFGLLWCFMGVAIVSDIFMGAIERITSKKVRYRDPSGKNVTIKVWNDTVANLTLMALGSSAPEILLSVIELTTNKFLSGDLGPATIVGSAAFNLFCISAVCIMAIPNGEVRRIKDVGVFAVTASFSVFAYLWLYFIVLVVSPDEIDIGEGVLTFFFFPVLVAVAFCADKGYFSFDAQSLRKGPVMPRCIRSHEMEYLATSRDTDGWACDGRFQPGGCRSGITDYHQTKGVDRYRCERCDYDLCRKCVESCQKANTLHRINSDVSKEELAAIEMRILQQHGDALTDDQVAKLIQKEHGQPHSRAAYRVAAIRSMVGGRKISQIDVSPQYSLTAIVPLDCSSRSSESERRPVLCPQSHPMRTFITHKANFNCDVCTKLFPAGTTLYGCRACNFDACAVCKVGFVKADITIQFQSSNYAVLESVGTLVTQVLRLGDISQRVYVEYRTRDGTAKAHEDYIPVEGKLEFDVGEVHKNLEIQIVDDTSYEEDEEFFIDLLNAASTFKGTKVVVGENRSAKVSIVDDDMPGVLSFTEDTKSITEGINNQVITVTVKREHGSAGVISCKYRTEDATATAGRDYLASSGTLTFGCGQLSRDISLTVLSGAHYDSTEEFRLIIESPEGGATFDPTTDGGEECCVCTVVILSDEAARGRVDRVMKVLMMDWDKAHIGHKNWKEQFLEAVYVNGGEEDGEAGFFDYIMHVVTVFWKVLFAVIPPADFCDGWLCFVCALIMIGVVTAFIGDLASLLGCTLDIPDKITAITFVALGTSLPDTFASKTAAEQDPYADASIGNVTGSNSVNVFLGLGLPWVIGSIYWKAVGQTDVWKEEYSKQDKYSEWIAKDRGMFIVIGGDLGFSVAVFSICAVICIAVLLVRRNLFGGELGGPRIPQLVTGAFLVFLWFLYVGLSSYQILSNRDDCR